MAKGGNASFIVTASSVKKFLQQSEKSTACERLMGKARMTAGVCGISTECRSSSTQSRRQSQGLHWRLDSLEDKHCWIIKQGQSLRTRLRARSLAVKNTPNLGSTTKTVRTARNSRLAAILGGTPRTKKAAILRRWKLCLLR